MEMQLLLNLTAAAILFFIGMEDWKTMEIPDRYQLMLAGCGAAAVFVFPEVDMLERIIGFFCVSAPMFLLCLLEEGAFGGGDIKLAAVMGFYLGWRACLVGFAIGIFLGGLQAMALLIRGKVKYGEGAHMAFGPALCTGFFLAEFYGTEIFRWYLDIWMKA